MMIGVLGSEEAFYYQYGTQFSSSDNCLVSRECLRAIRDNTDEFVNTNNQNDFNDAGIALTLQYFEHLYVNKNYDLRWFVDGHHFYVVLVDLAEGSGGDYTVFNIIRIYYEGERLKFEQVAYWRANDVNIDRAALEFWLLCVQLFNRGNALISIEWNTYGALFYQLLLKLNEHDEEKEMSWRWNVTDDVFDIYNIAKYKRETIEQQVIGKISHSAKFIPGIKFTSSNKPAACTLLKMLFERSDIILTDTTTCNELESFEDKNGSGTYKASYGHDDIIMTFCQIPLLQQTIRFQNWLDEIRYALMNEKNTRESSLYDDSSINMYDTTQYDFPRLDFNLDMSTGEINQVM
jgi:hypothetical protein